MSLVPSPHRIQVRQWVIPTEPDEFGNREGSLGPARDWYVRSIDPVSNREPGRENRDLSTIAYTIHADNTSLVPSYRDVVVIDGTEYPVDGEPDDWTRGPWSNPVAGVTVWVKRVEG